MKAFTLITINGEVSNIPEYDPQRFHKKLQQVKIVDKYVGEKNGDTLFCFEYENPDGEKISVNLSRGLFLTKSAALAKKKEIYKKYVDTAICLINNNALRAIRKKDIPDGMSIEEYADKKQIKSLKGLLKNKHHLYSKIQTNTPPPPFFGMNNGN